MLKRSFRYCHLCAQHVKVRGSKHALEVPESEFFFIGPPHRARQGHTRNENPTGIRPHNPEIGAAEGSAGYVPAGMRPYPTALVMAALRPTTTPSYPSLYPLEAYVPTSSHPGLARMTPRARLGGATTDGPLPWRSGASSLPAIRSGQKQLS